MEKESKCKKLFNYTNKKLKNLILLRIKNYKIKKYKLLN